MRTRFAVHVTYIEGDEDYLTMTDEEIVSYMTVLNLAIVMSVDFKRL